MSTFNNDRLTRSECIEREALPPWPGRTLLNFEMRSKSVACCPQTTVSAVLALNDHLGDATLVLADQSQARVSDRPLLGNWSDYISLVEREVLRPRGFPLDQTRVILRSQSGAFWLHSADQMVQWIALLPSLSRSIESGSLGAFLCYFGLTARRLAFELDAAPFHRFGEHRACHLAVNDEEFAGGASC